MMLLGAGVFFLLTGPGRHSSLVFESTSEQPPTSTPISISQPTPPEPTPTPTPDPYQRYRELEEQFFPVLSQLRALPGNEGALVDWELRGPYSGVVYTTPSGKHKGIFYVVYGVKKIPVDMILPNIRDPRYRPEAGVYIQRGWEVLPNGGAYGAFKPDGRVRFNCAQEGIGVSSCRLEGDIIVVNEPERGIWLIFTIYNNGEWGYTVPEWDGPLPPTRGGGE
jgi:hypothetical protein